MKKAILFFGCATAMFLTACSVHTVPEQPDAVIIEKPAAPSPDVVWVADEWRWDGTTYVLVPGHYVSHRGAFVPGHWKHTKKGHKWVRGHWR